MNLIEAIFARRAVRSYAPRTVDEPTIRTLLHAAVQAPSAMNAQSWGFAVVQDTATLKRYSDRGKQLLLEQTAAEPKARKYEEMLRNEGFNIFYDASTLVVICTTQRGPYSDADCWLAAENLILLGAALAVGIMAERAGGDFARIVAFGHDLRH